MPIYEYEVEGGDCNLCGGRFELRRPADRESLTDCPVCRKPVHKFISQVSTPVKSKPLPSATPRRRALPCSNDGIKAFTKRNKGLHRFRAGGKQSGRQSASPAEVMNTRFTRRIPAIMNISARPALRQSSRRRHWLMAAEPVVTREWDSPGLMLSSWRLSRCWCCSTAFSWPASSRWSRCAAASWMR